MPASHDGKALLHILEGFPARRAVPDVAETSSSTTALGILHLQERQRIALFVRRDPFERFISCLVYLPRDRYTTELSACGSRRSWREAYHGKLSAFYTQVTDDELARLQIIIDTTPGAIPDVDQAELEARLVEVGRSWTDHLQEALVEAHGEEQGFVLLRRYANAFPLSYRERFTAQAAVLDIQHAEAVLAAAADRHQPLPAASNRAGPELQPQALQSPAQALTALRRAADPGAYGAQGAERDPLPPPARRLRRQHLGP